MTPRRPLVLFAVDSYIAFGTFIDYAERRRNVPFNLPMRKVYPIGLDSTSVNLYTSLGYF